MISFGSVIAAHFLSDLEDDEEEETVAQQWPGGVIPDQADG
jgi:hypothetical protein